MKTLKMAESINHHSFHPSRTYNWTAKSTILSAFFWGYILPQVGAGQLAERFGSKWLLTSGMALTSVFTVLIPFMADLGAWGVMVCRAAQGLTQGFFTPCMHNLLSKWVPLAERSRMGTFTYAGGPLGTVISALVTGFLCASSMGWPSSFYLYGGAGFLWTFAWWQFGASDPSQHKQISEEEKMYIAGSNKENNLQSKSKKNISTPWLCIMKSLPFWSIFITHCGQSFGYIVLLTQTPRFLHSILHFNIKENGLLSSAPSFSLWVLSFVFSYLTDMVVNRKIYSVATARKIATAIGSIGPAICIFVLAIMDPDQRAIIIILMTAAVGLVSATLSGFKVNHIDIAPSYAGTLMGITNCGANIFSIFATLLVEFIVTDDRNASQWRTVFFVTSAIYLACCLVFVIFGQGKRQYWDKLSTSDEPEIENLKKTDYEMKNVEQISK